MTATHPNEQSNTQTDAPTEAPLLYPVDSTAWSASLLVRVTIKKVRHDRRQVEWTREGDDRPFSNWFGLNELSDSDDPHTRMTLGQDKRPAPTNPALPHDGLNLALMTIPDDSPLATASYAERMAAMAPKKQPAANDAPPMHDTDTESALIGWTRAKMAVTAPAPTITLHPADPLTVEADESTIAQEEIDAAQMANKLGEKIAEWDATIKDLEAERDDLKNRLRIAVNETVRALQRRDAAEQALEDMEQRVDDEDYSTIERLVMESNAELSQRIKALEQEAKSPQPRKIETMKLTDPSDDELAGYRNRGWRVVFETIIVLPDYGKEFQHFLRLEREVIDTDTPPQDEAHAAASVPLFAGLVSAVGETPVEEDVERIQQPAGGVCLVGVSHREPIDPRDIDVNLPTRELLSKYRVEDVIAAKDLALEKVMQTALKGYQANTPPVRTLTQALQQHA